MADEMYTPEKPGAWHRIVAFLKRFWAVSLVALVPLIPEFVELWGMNNPFPAVPEIITEAEVREISDYALAWTAASGKTINCAINLDRDGDGTQDSRFYAFACDEPERTEWYVRTSMELPSLWQVITGECDLAPQEEEFAIQDGRVCIIVTVSGETAGDRSELRWMVDQVLTFIREDMADGEVDVQSLSASPLEKLLQGIGQTEE